MAKIIYRVQYTKSNRNKNKGDKDSKSLFKLINNVAYGKTMKNLRKRIDVRLVRDKRTIQNGPSFWFIKIQLC